MDGSHWLQRRAKRIHPDLLISNSRFTEERVRPLYPGVASRFAFFPVVAPKVGSGTAEVRNRLRTELGTRPEEVVIVVACRLEQYKGHRLLIESLARLKGEPGWRCWIVGGPQRPKDLRYLQELQETTRREGLSDRVRFVGQRSDVYDLYLAADIHCQPNTGPEPFGRAFVEAMYCHLPVVTVAIGGAAEVLGDGGGLLVSQSSEEVARALSLLIRDRQLRAEMGARGAIRARELCDCAAQLRKLETIVASA
jgi:glycosyltransferase involved in cell wall biosynthesis